MAHSRFYRDSNRIADHIARTSIGPVPHHGYAPIDSRVMEVGPRQSPSASPLPEWNTGNVSPPRALSPTPNNRRCTNQQDSHARSPGSPRSAIFSPLHPAASNPAFRTLRLLSVLRILLILAAIPSHRHDSSPPACALHSQQLPSPIGAPVPHRYLVAYRDNSIPTDAGARARVAGARIVRNDNPIGISVIGPPPAPATRPQPSPPCAPTPTSSSSSTTASSPPTPSSFAPFSPPPSESPPAHLLPPQPPHQLQPQPPHQLQPQPLSHPTTPAAPPLRKPGPSSNPAASAPASPVAPPTAHGTPP